MKKSFCFVVGLLGLSLVGCATPKALFLVADYPQRQPHTIAVLPIDDARLVKQGDDPHLEGELVKALKGCKYDVQELETTRQRLQQVNILGDAITQTAPAQLCQALGADAVLQSRLTDYESTYQVIIRTDRLEMTVTIIEGKTGEALWKERIVKHESTFGVIPASISPISEWLSELFWSLPKRQSVPGSS